MASQEHLLRQRIATEHRRRDPDPDLIADLQRERAVVRIAAFANRVLATAPALTIDQRQKLAELVLGGANGTAA